MNTLPPTPPDAISFPPLVFALAASTGAALLHLLNEYLAVQAVLALAFVLLVAASLRRFDDKMAIPFLLLCVACGGAGMLLGWTIVESYH